MELNIAKDVEELSERTAAWIANHIQSVLSKKDRFSIALSGGNTPKKVYELLASGKFEIDWKRMHFFWGDERMVPFSDERNNAKMAFTYLLDLVPVKKEQVYIIRTDLEPEAAAIDYEQTLRKYFRKSNTTFDLVLLGLGEDAHTLSLFPESDIIREHEKWVYSFYLKEQKMYRTTLTPPIVNSAQTVLFLVNGKDKANAVHHVLEDQYDPRRYPAQVIRPANDEIYWFLDEAAAENLH